MKQSYVPPHKRIDKKDIKTYKTLSDKKKNEEKKLNINDTKQFPDLNNKPILFKENLEKIENKPTLSSIFKKSLLNKKKVKKSNLKKGWIHLTKNGIIDSLTPEERKKEDEEYLNRIIQINLQKILLEHERNLQYRKENDYTYRKDNDYRYIWNDVKNTDDYRDNESEEESECDSYEDFSNTDDDFYEYENNREFW
jgi:hypothetical protein